MGVRTVFLLLLCLMWGCGSSGPDGEAVSEPLDDAGGLDSSVPMDSEPAPDLRDDPEVVEGCGEDGCPEGELCTAEGTCTGLNPACEVIGGRPGGQRIALLMPSETYIDVSDWKLAAAVAVAEFNASFPPLEVVACVTGDVEERATELYQYLVDELAVAAFVGPLLSDTILEMHRTVVHRGALVLTPSAGSAEVAALEDAGLIWRISSSQALIGQAAADRAVELSSSGDGELIVVYDAHEPIGLEATAGARARLEGQGATVVELDIEGWEQAIDQAFPSRIPPEVVLYFGHRAPEVLDRVEAKVAGGPRWVIDKGFYTLRDLREAAERHDALERIDFLANHSGLGGPAKEHFEGAFEAAYGRDGSSHLTGHVYDAVWALALAGLSPPASQRDGAGYAAGLRFVLDPEGHPRVLGDDISGASPRNFPWRLMGAGSRMDIDLETGDGLSGIWRWRIYSSGILPVSEYDGRAGTW